jgi:hypothetical protein
LLDQEFFEYSEKGWVAPIPESGTTDPKGRFTQQPDSDKAGEVAETAGTLSFQIPNFLTGV